MRRRKKQNSWITLSVSVGAIVLFGLVSVFLVWISGNTGDAFSGKWDDYDVILDENCAPGALEGECDRTQVEYGSLRDRLNTAPWFADSSTSGTVCFQNDGGNQHFVRISYRLGDEEVYRSEMIPPDSHIDRACLDKKLLAGNYDGVCQIELFDMDTLELLGTLEEKITITIQK